MSRALRKHGAGKVFREMAQGDKADRAQLRRVIDRLAPDDVLMVTRLDQLARSTRDLLNTLAANLPVPGESGFGFAPDEPNVGIQAP